MLIDELIEAMETYSSNVVTKKFLSDEQKDDEVFLKSLLAKRNAITLANISKRLLGDRNFIKYAIMNYATIDNISDELKDDDELMLLAIKYDHNDYFYISDRLKASREFTILAIQIDPDVFIYFNDRHKDDIEIVRLAIIKYEWPIHHASDRLQKLGREKIINYKYYERVHDINLVHFSDSDIQILN